MKWNTDIGLLLCRIAIGGPMLIYGITKIINGIDFILDILTEMGVPTFIGYGVYLGEVLAPLMILIGIKIRFAAFVFAVNCLTALFLTQIDYVFSLNAIGGWSIELLIIYTLVGLGLMFTGAGKYAVNADSK